MLSPLSLPQDLAETDLQKELLLNMTKGQHDLEQVEEAGRRPCMHAMMRLPAFADSDPDFKNKTTTYSIFSTTYSKE